MNYYQVLAFLCMLLWVIKIATVQVIIIIIIIISHFGNSVTVKLPARFSWSQVLSYPPYISLPTWSHTAVVDSN